MMMDWAPFDGDSDLIQDNSLLGGDLATQYLIDKGHTRIACITGPLDKTPARLRLEGYRAAMKRAGLNIPDGYEVTGDFDLTAGLTPCANCYHIRCVLRPSLPEMTLWLLAFTGAVSGRVTGSAGYRGDWL